MGGKCNLYCGLNLDCNYDKGCVYVSMKDYLCCALLKFQQKRPYKTQNDPHQWNIPVYEQRTAQWPIATSQASLIEKYRKHQIQPIYGTFLYYYKIDPCIKPALNEIASKSILPRKILFLNNICYLTTSELTHMPSSNIIPATWFSSLKPTRLTLFHQNSK